ncbi:MAG TPA: FAD-dependent oxidoreductase, partial [Verrucomicrobiota bacterium]|nr:FAD-dependent oxidoreductase [Verrucomicrobiota bacterium]
MKQLSVFCGIASVCYSLIASDAILPADSIPVFDDVDVVVVGGTSGGVSAAVSAAKSGARVFLISERSFLGEDICSTYRLWLEPDEKPLTELAKEVFKPFEVSKISIGASLPFTYKADKPTAKVHPDRTPPKILCDGKWKNAANESVQYDDNVNIIVELSQPETIGKVHLLAYQRVSDFEVSRVVVSYSDDANSWKPLTEIKNKDQGTGNYEGEALDLSATVQPVKAKYLKFSVFKSNDAKRLLLGEIVVEKQAEENVNEPISVIRAVTPMQVKRTFDQNLINAGVKFLFWSYPIDIIRDSKGNPAGVVIVNRSGKQAILAKVIIDATIYNVVAKMAGVQFSVNESGAREFYRVVVGGEPQIGQNIQLVNRQPTVVATGRKGETYPVYEYKMLFQIDDGNFSSLARAEQMARDWTLTTNCVDSSEILFSIPQHTFKAKKSVTEWNGTENFPIECFQPEGMQNLFVLSAAADVSKQVAAKLSRPVNMMAIGEQVGKAVFENSKNINLSTPFKVVGRQATNPVRGEVRFTEQHNYHRIDGTKSIAKETTTLPVIGEYDVVVVGGGTGGAPAAIASGRKGVRTLLIEHLHTLGGTGTAGLISSYYFGNRVGFTKEIDLGVAKMSGLDGRTSSVWMPDIKSEWYRKELRKAGVDIWFGTFGSGVLVESNKVKGVVVSTPMGTGIVLAKV